MQTQYVLKQAGLTLPVTKLFQQHIVTLLAEQSQQTSVRAVVINFRDPDYSAESGGFHPVEMRFIRQDNEWYFDYVTDFSYMGRVYLNRPGFPGECFICELRLPDHRFRWKH
uniref:DUF2787 family protein n=1 Tax=Escherichia coli TaxID=562 RepID=UPI001E3F12B7